MTRPRFKREIRRRRNNSSARNRRSHVIVDTRAARLRARRADESITEQSERQSFPFLARMRNRAASRARA